MTTTTAAPVTEPVTLGGKYRDTITGFEGTCVGRYEYLFGCVRISLEASELKDGEPRSAVFDEQRLVTLAGGDVPAPTATSGGPRDAPPSRDPAR